MVRVLVVEDDRDTAELMTTLLGLWGHRAFSTCDGAEAVAVSGRWSPDVVLLDLALPGMDGYEVARQIRRHGGKQPVIVCISGYGQDDDRRSRAAGCDHHFLKPADPDELRRLLQAVGARRAPPSGEARRGDRPCGGAPTAPGTSPE
jgi:CheY-like chemotaxis protein